MYSAVRVALSCGILCLLPGPALAQDPEPQSIQEVGGRLVTTSETVVVKGDADAPITSSSIATKVDVPLIETPRSISIMDRRTLDDIGAINITQAHDYIVGLTPQDERGPGFARGFPVDFYDLRRDGLRTYSWSVREPAALDRVQYLRGSSSVLYGDGSPGGLVNLVLKKPLPVPRYEVSGSAGALGLARLSADATGPFNGAKTARYRIIAAGEWLDNGFDNDERRLTLFPSATVDLGRRATLSLDTEIYHQEGRNSRHGIPATPEAQRGDFSNFPWDLSVAGPGDGWSGSNIAPGLRLDVALGARSSLHVSARYTRINGDLDLQAPLAMTADGTSVVRFHYREISTWDEYQSDTFAATVVRTGAIEHKLVAGIEAGLSTTDTRIGVGPSAPLDIHDPQYGPAPSDPALIPTRYDVTRVGLYVAAQIRVSPKLTVVPGLRWSQISVDDKVAAAGGLDASSSDADVSPSLGLVVLPRPWFALYSTYTEGFEPPGPGQYLEGGAAPALSENRMLEAGAKADLLRERLSLTAAAFRIRRTNVAELDPLGFYRQIGEGRSHGLELEAVGALTRGLTTRLGYAWTATEITRDTLGATGRELPNAPHHKVNAWLRYRCAPGLARGLMVAGGVVHVSDRFTARDNRVVAPGYTRADASASVEIAGPRVTAFVTAENITNRRYVRSGSSTVLFAGPPRRVALQIVSTF